MQTAALVHFCSEVAGLEIIPDDKEFVLAQGSSLTFTCSASSQAMWDIKREDSAEYFDELNGKASARYTTFQSDAMTLALTLINVTWQHTGVYQCIDVISREIKEALVLVPGKIRFVFLLHDDVLH